MKRFRTGDIFRIPIHEEIELSGRVMLDIHRQCMKPQLIDNTSALAFYNKTLIVDIYAGPDPEYGLLVAGASVEPDPLRRGDWTIGGHLPVDPQTVAFPERISSFGSKMFLQCGEVELPLGPLENTPGVSGFTWKGVSIANTWMSATILNARLLALLGRADLIDPRWSRISDLGAEDLRYHPRCAEVRADAGRTPDLSCYELGLLHGFDLARFY